MQLPTIILVCCEGKETEPQYLRAVVRQRRINEGRVAVHVRGGVGQHIKLVNEAAIIRTERSRELQLNEEDIEVWAVCDKDTMPCTLEELEKHAIENNVRLAFTDPKFETFLLQHFGFSSTNAMGRALTKLLSDSLKSKGLAKTYAKNDLSWVAEMLDNEPLLLEQAISNASKLNDKTKTPYMTVQELLARLIEISPPAS